ncbi:hypothetical protein ACIBL3_47205, partial [Kribbella sp. NPDC050124]|uniref:hypothetical protein n=1 Tax=Kribbella sp. NPDC050124 TaxID=3364114 RepID=UPI00378BC8F7
VVEAAITVTITDPNTGDKRREEHHYRLVTSLLDPAVASAFDLVRLYHERWGATRGRTSRVSYLRRSVM